MGCLILGANVCRLSVVSHLELAIVLERQAKPDAARQAEAFLRAASIVVEPVTLQQGALARQAYYDFGRGNNWGLVREPRRLFRLRTGESDGRAAAIQGSGLSPHRCPRGARR